MFDKTEEEQIQIIKEWLRRNFIWLVGALILIAAGSTGWYYLQQNTLDNQLQASALYEDVERRLQALHRQTDQTEKSRLLEEIAASYAAISGLFPGTIYTQMSAQLYATALAASGQYEQAATELEALSQSEDSLIRNNSRIDLAKVHWQLGEVDKALALLSNPGIGFESIAKELEGDIYLSQNQLEQAAAAYQEAIDTQPAPSSVLRIKLNYVTR